jgi:hypothetical protein
MARVVPSERFRAELDEALAGVGAERDPLEVIGRVTSRSVVYRHENAAWSRCRVRPGPVVGSRVFRDRGSGRTQVGQAVPFLWAASPLV